MMHDDEDLRQRFHALADEDRAAAPAFEPPPRVLHVRQSAARRLVAVAATVIAVVSALAIGMVWGSNTGYASGRSEGDRQRAVIAANARGATSQLAALRFELARTRSDLLSRATNTGGSASLAAVDAELRAIEASVSRIEMDLAPPSSAFRPLPSPNRAMNRAFAMTCSALAIGAAPLNPSAPKPPAQQQGVPVVDLPAASVQASATFGGPMGVRQLSNGKVMINDGQARQIKLFDSTLTTFTLVSDSTPGSSTYYGPWSTQLVPYFGDTSVFGDVPSQTLLVLGPTGEVSRVIAPPGDRSVIGALISARSAGFDPQGRLIYTGDRGTKMMRNIDPATGKSVLRIEPPPDSLPITRADFAARRLDTLARVMRGWIGGKLESVPRPDGKGDMPRATFNPIIAVDEFAVLSDGTVGTARAHDYHVEWIAPDGTRSATGKLPFDWKRLTDEDKQRLIDSAKAALDLDAHNAAAIAGLSVPPSDPGIAGGRGQRGGGGAAGRTANAPRGGMSLFAIASPAEIPDFYPPIRLDAALADRDGNLWVLPSTSAQSKQGELVYDVINPKRGLFERVRLPLGRSVLGFGPNGVVYMMSGDRATGFKVEKTRLK
jgi:hypothetical protein